MSGMSNHIFEEKMAIPEGGAPEAMDVSCHSDDSPGYVSIKAKGPGRPINIRIGGKVQTLSQYIHANTCRPPVSNEYVQSQLLPSQSESQFEERSDDFLDKKTGDALTFDSISPETVGSLDLEPKEPDQNAERITAKLQESDKKNIQQDSGFSSQSEVVSLASKLSDDHQGILESPAKRKYRLSQEGSKKKVGSKKNSPGKDDRGLRLVQRQAPYPKWMNLPLKEILKQQGYYVDIEGKKHLLQVNFVPVENELETTQNRKQGAGSERDPTVVNNIISEGSIDRPPDASLSLDQSPNQASAVYPVASTQPSTNTQYNEGNNPGYQASMTGIMSAPNIYGNAYDQPLDLTVAKPLDLSKKDKSTSNVLEGDNSVPAQPNEEVNSPVVTDMDNTSMNVRGETYITDYRIRCPSTASAYDRESEVGDEAYDTDLSTDQCQNYSEQNNVSDGNLPSLGRLTLECNSKHNTSTQNCAVQDSAVEQEIANIVCKPEESPGGQQYIVDLVNSGQVSFHQLLSMYCQNQQRKSANIQQCTSSHSSNKDEADLIQQQQLQANVAVSQADNAEGEQGIQALAMPNLCSLQLANIEGGIFETEEERVRNKLKEKLRQKQNV